MLLREIELAEVCERFPMIQPFDPLKCEDEKDQIFICACGFEERSLSIPLELKQCGNYSTKHSIVLEHETNVEDNIRNLPKLTENLRGFTSGELLNIGHGEDFIKLEEAVKESIFSCSRIEGHPIPNVTLDISGLSSRMLLIVLKTLFSQKINLKILYAEAEVYHPTLEEYQQHPEDWTVDGTGMSKGILKVSELNLYSSQNMRELPTMLLAFPTFKPERIRSIQAELQAARTIWVLGVPHDVENQWRTEAMREINGIPESELIEELSTFSYAEAFSLLERTYKEKGDKFHIVIAPHGSKLNNIGVALFCMLRQDVGLWFSTPEAFNPSQYTGSVRDLWQINIRDVDSIVNIVRSCGKLVLQAT